MLSIYTGQLAIASVLRYCPVAMKLFLTKLFLTYEQKFFLQTNDLKLVLASLY